ncbi:MAG TPA: PQQ-binding-like beta-propeller repeat protein, partial [Vicinamibacterales bacterium]|nr:PQQ-binding-like beta-propeller repeat protein [Vicinamibacterales bacterium]
MTRRFAGGIIALAFVWIALVSAQQKPPVDDAALRAPEARNQDWLSYGRDYYEQRFSPLDQINDKNVAQLGLAWQFETATQRGLEATPLVVDGVMYATGSWSVTYAIDARTG